METTTIVGTDLDYAIIVAYFVAIFGFGALFARFTKSTKDFFFGGQRFAWWLVAFSYVASIVGSYSWSTKAVEQIAGLIPNLKVELLDPVLVKGSPREADLAALNRLADSIVAKHAALGLS